MNDLVGWLLVFFGFASGAYLGLRAQNEDFLGGYLSRKRRLVRLGHIALVALGGLNVFWGQMMSLADSPPDLHAWAGWGFLVGGCTMGPVCFLTAWRWGLRVFFLVPTTSLLLGAALAFWETLP
jgi:hypothetical protein